jgi:hypothetical protein
VIVADEHDVDTVRSKSGPQALRTERLLPKDALPLAQE